MGFASVDPWKEEAGIAELDRSVRDLGLKGLKLHPIHQAFFPNDKRFYPLYIKCVELGGRCCSTRGSPPPGLACQAALG